MPRGLCGLAPALGVGEPETARTALLSADAILFLERVNDVTRLLVDPARDGHDEELQHVGNRRHTGRAEQRLSAVTNVATRRASSVESARRTASIGFLDSTGLAWPVAVNGPEGRARHPGNANIRFMGFCAHDILSALQPRLAASTGSACTSAGIPEPSHVLRAIGLDGDEAESSIRFSLGFGTGDADVEAAVGLIEETLARLSKVDLVRLARPVQRPVPESS